MPCTGHPDHQLPRAEDIRARNGKLTGMTFEIVRAEYDAKGRRSLVPTGEPDAFFPCDDVLVAVGKRTLSRGSNVTAASSSTSGACQARCRDISPPSAKSSSAAMPRSARRTSSPRSRTGMGRVD